jgi:hypothetical protein
VIIETIYKKFKMTVVVFQIQVLVRFVLFSNSRFLLVSVRPFMNAIRS